MIVESIAGKFSVTSAKDPEYVIVSSDNQATIVSILDGVELVGGETDDNPTFSLTDIYQTKMFGRAQFSTRLSRPQLTRYFEYEILNFLTYPSLTQMRKSPVPTP